MRSNRSRMSRTAAMNSASREPASCSIAAFTVALVVSGPGVNSNLSVDMVEVLFLVAVAEINPGDQVMDPGQRVARRLPRVLPADVCGIHYYVLDAIGWNLARVLAQHREVSQFARRDRSLVVFFKCGIGAVERPHLDGFLHADALIDSVAYAVLALASDHV